MFILNGKNDRSHSAHSALNTSAYSLRSFGFMIVLVTLLSACSLNPATGERQFTAFMSPEQELRVGASEHGSIMANFGGTIDNDGLKTYVSQVGQSLAAQTEVPQSHAPWNYQFFVLDSPVVNAFALPGGYVYVSRGLLALANSEAELAAVLGHEIGHVTARHSAERYSRGVLTNFATSILASSVDTPGVGDLARLGSQVYLSSYSRGQESQADELGIRYMDRVKYDRLAAARFLNGLDQQSQLQDLIAREQEGAGGASGAGRYSFLSTHPKTKDRVEEARKIALSKENMPGSLIRKETYLKQIDGIVFGDNPSQGVVNGRDFLHPELDVAFTVPDEFRLVNNRDNVVAVSKDKGLIVFDSAPRPEGITAQSHLQHVWMGDVDLQQVEQITINGKPAVTGFFKGQVQGRASRVQAIVVQWSQDRFFRFIMAVPENASDALVDEFKRATYSLRNLSAQDRIKARPQIMRIITAKPGDTVASLSSKQSFDRYSQKWFRLLNGMNEGEQVVAGQMYKLVIRP